MPGLIPPTPRLHAARREVLGGAAARGGPARGVLTGQLTRNTTAWPDWPLAARTPATIAEPLPSTATDCRRRPGIVGDRVRFGVGTGQRPGARVGLGCDEDLARLKGRARARDRGAVRGDRGVVPEKGGDRGRGGGRR